MLIATDYADGMLNQAKKKLKTFKNVIIENADITKLNYSDNSFDKVVAGNVIHILSNPELALKELERVCKPRGLIIIPTYINNTKGTSRAAVKFMEIIGANFKRQFDKESYEKFFCDLGYKDAKYYVVNGRMACDIAVIENIKH